jgi:hypothetical protein
LNEAAGAGDASRETNGALVVCWTYPRDAPMPNWITSASSTVQELTGSVDNSAFIMNDSARSEELAFSARKLRCRGLSEACR